MSLGRNIKQLREREGIQQKDFAVKIGVSNVVLSRYESDERKPDYDTLQKIADYFEVTTDYLLGRTDDPKLINYNKNDSESTSPRRDQEEFEAWLNDPKVDKFYREFNESSEERKEALLAVWEILKKQGR